MSHGDEIEAARSAAETASYMTLMALAVPEEDLWASSIASLLAALCGVFAERYWAKGRAPTDQELDDFAAGVAQRVPEGVEAALKVFKATR